VAKAMYLVIIDRMGGYDITQETIYFKKIVAGSALI
jgi:hypothetical protein